MGRGAAAIGLAAVLATGCHGQSNPTAGQQPRHAPPSRSRETPPPPDPRAALSRGNFDGDETFCESTHPANRVRYVVSHGSVTLHLELGGLLPRRGYYVGWRNAHSPRGYDIASLRTNAAGSVRRGTLRMFRGAETRGSFIVLNPAGHGNLRRLRRCP